MQLAMAVARATLDNAYVFELPPLPRRNPGRSVIRNNGGEEVDALRPRHVQN